MLNDALDRDHRPAVQFSNNQEVSRWRCVPAVELTVAVKVIALPTTAGFALGLSAIVGVTLFTASEAALVTVAKLASPE
jgi:hypothetical protein